MVKPGCSDNFWNKIDNFLKAEESSLQSFFGRLNYNYGGRYLLEMNVRHDGSSRMPKANPVSYTHLDVYKRQVLPLGMTECGSIMSKPGKHT